MKGITISLLIVNTITSLTGIIAVTAMLLQIAAHPLATDDPWLEVLFFGLPYLILAGTGWMAFPRLWLLVLVMATTTLVFVVVTAACYQHVQIALHILNSRAAGHDGGSCGPPLYLFALPAAYGMAVVTAVIALMFLPFQPGQSSIAT